MFRARLAVSLALAYTTTLLGTAPSAGQTEAAKRFQAHAKEAAAAYDIRTVSTDGRKLMLQTEPILRWTNPVPEKQMHGDVFLWTDEGRPAAVLCLFEMTESGGVREYHEFCSLAAGGLVSTGSDKRKSAPAASQLTMSPLANAPLPAATPRQRLSQMRELAAQFSCEKTNRMGDTRVLRLLPQPVLRYESPLHDVMDGALFAFVEATDPEVFLLLELRSVSGKPAWHFGLARMASVRMQVSLDNHTVWKVETLPYEGYRNRPDLPYTLLFVP